MDPEQEDELLDVVDEQDRVIGVAGRRDIHEKGLLHRAVHVFVVDQQQGIYLQKRAWHKDEHPGKWDSSASGHVDSGESYVDAARRELEEELGFEAPLEPILTIPACPETNGEHSMLFLSRQGEQRLTPRPNPAEIMEGRFFGVQEIKERIAGKADLFSPSFILLFERFQGETIGSQVLSGKVV